MNIGYSVVHIHGSDKTIYKVVLTHGDGTCDIESVYGSKKTISISHIREANDVELMVGYKLDVVKLTYR